MIRLCVLLSLFDWTIGWGCPSGWVKSSSRVACYLSVSATSNWLAAASSCSSLGAAAGFFRGYLASITSDAEAALVETLCQTASTSSNGCWFGLHDPAATVFPLSYASPLWVFLNPYVDSSWMRSLSLPYWFPGRPDTIGYTAITMYKWHGWPAAFDDDFITSSYSYICEAIWCPSGYYCSLTNATRCPAGSYCPSNSTNYTTCSSGSYSSAGAAACTLCSSGSFAPLNGSTSCTACPNGWTSNVTGAIANSSCNILSTIVSCPSGWNASSSRMACYLARASSATWTLASSSCSSLARSAGFSLGYLASMTTSAEAFTVEALCIAASTVSNGCWFGLNDPSASIFPVSASSPLWGFQNPFASNIWMTSLQGQSYWAYGRPDNKAYSAVALWKSHGWALDDDWITDSLSYVCEGMWCPAGFICISGAASPCPAGSFCPYATNASLCSSGSFSNAGASTCTLCPAGTFTSATGSTSCQQCPGGHYCPAGTSSWARLNCGRGNYCPDGSGSPTPCPYQVPPTGGWGALQVQGPAFLVETARCLNHCFWNFTSGDGMLSKC